MLLLLLFFFFFLIIIIIILRQYILAVAIIVGYSGGGGLWVVTRFLVVRLQAGIRFLVVIRLLERDRKENREINKQIKSSVNGCP